MGVYNTVAATLRCPRCGAEVIVDAEVRSGYRDQLLYAVGDLYEWRPRKAVQNGGRPPDGNLDGEGYAECPACSKDFFVVVTIRNDVISGVAPDLARSGWVPDQ